MAEITIFWGEKNEPSFNWRLSRKPLNEPAQSPIHQLESRELLKADLASLADMCENLDVSLVISCNDASAMQVDMPNKAQRLFRKAVPYILEDEVASPIDDLFFALEDKTKSGNLNVIIIKRDYLQSLIDIFKQAEIRLSEILIDFDLISAPEEGTKVVIHSNQCLIVDEKNNRWHSHLDDFSWLVQKQLNLSEADDELPIAQPMDIFSEQATDVFVRQLPVGRFAAQAEHVSDIYEFMLDQNNNNKINLLQAEFEVKKENSKLSDFLRKVATIAALTLTTHLLYQSANIYALSEKKQQLEAQKITLYKQAFPNTKKIKSPVKKMRVHVKSLGSSSTNGDFLSLLTSASEKLTDLTKIHPTNISYDKARNELRIDLIASDLTILDQYAESLKSTGHKVERSSETQRGDGYSSRLTIIK